MSTPPHLAYRVLALVATAKRVSTLWGVDRSDLSDNADLGARWCPEARPQLPVVGRAGQAVGPGGEGSIHRDRRGPRLAVDPSSRVTARPRHE
jgi:hypothetical protein